MAQWWREGPRALAQQALLDTAEIVLVRDGSPAVTTFYRKLEP